MSENKRLAAFERLSQVSGLWDDLKIVLKNGLPKNFNSLFYSIICGIFAQSLLLALRNIYLLTHMVTAMMKGDKSMFWRSFWYHIGHGIVSTWVDYYMLKWHCDLQRGIYKSMTNKMMNKYISKVGYYTLKTLDKRIKDPMRITDDIDKFAIHYSIATRFGNTMQNIRFWHKCSNESRSNWKICVHFWRLAIVYENNVVIKHCRKK